MKAKIKADSFWGDLANALVLSPVHREPKRKPVKYEYLVRDHAGFMAVGTTFDTRAEALTFMHEARGVEIVDGMFLADGYWVDMAEVR